MNRKLLSIIVIATLLLASLVVLAACTGKELPTPHVCQFVKKDTVAPTCIEEGYTKYLCKDCNKEIRRDLVAINPTAHRYTSYASVDPECTMTKEGVTLTTYGYTIKQCEYCNKYGFTVDEKTAPAHDWDEGKEIANDCNGRVMEYTCTTCEIVYQAVEKDDANHVIEVNSDESILPTYLNSGYTVFDCPCHKNYEKEYVAPKSAEHLTFEIFNDYQFGGGKEAYSVTGKTYISNSEVIVPYEYMGINVTKISTSAFQHAKNVKSITLTKNIKYIGDLAFYGATSLEKIVFIGTISEWKTLVKNSVGETSFDKAHEKATFYPSHWNMSVFPNDFDDATHNDYFYVECSDGRLYLDGKTMLLWDGNAEEYVSFVPADITVSGK